MEMLLPVVHALLNGVELLLREILKLLILLILLLHVQLQLLSLPLLDPLHKQLDFLIIIVQMELSSYDRLQLLVRSQINQAVLYLSSIF